MLILTLLQRTICILFILSLTGDCAVIPDVGLEHAKKKAASDQKWDTITRIKSRVGPKDRSSRDHLVNTLAKMADSSNSLPSVADEKDESLKLEARAKAVRESLRSGREIEIVRSTNPPSVKSTAGHVGYEERHRFNGVRFDELLGPSEPNVDYNSSRGTFDLQDSDDEDEDSGSENERESDSDLDSEVVGDSFQNNNEIHGFDSEPEEESGLSNVIADDSDDSDGDDGDEREQGYASQSRQSLYAEEDGTHQFDPFDSDDDTEDEPNIHWETSSKSKASKPRSKLTGSPSLEIKIAPNTEAPNPQVPVMEEQVAKAPEPEDLFVESPITEVLAHSIVHWKASSQSKVMGVKPVEQKVSEIHWKISSKSKADAGSNSGKR